MADMGHGMTWARMRATTCPACRQASPATEAGNPLVDMQAQMPMSKLDDPGIGLRDNGRRVLTYADLKSRSPIPTAASRPRTSSCT